VTKVIFLEAINKIIYNQKKGLLTINSIFLLKRFNFHLQSKDILDFGGISTDRYITFFVSFSLLQEIKHCSELSDIPVMLDANLTLF
jgi:hypothetical protein